MTARSTPCRWPHCGASADDEVLLDLVFVRHARFIKRNAEDVARRTGCDASDLAQAALIRLWRLGARRALARGDAYVRRVLITRMYHAARDEWRGWLRGRYGLPGDTDDRRPND